MDDPRVYVLGHVGAGEVNKNRLSLTKVPKITKKVKKWSRCSLGRLLLSVYVNYTWTFFSLCSI